jgi:hypothetical protein
VPACETVTAAVDAFSAAVAGWAADDPRRVSLALARAYAARIDAADGDWRMGEALVSLIRTLSLDVEEPPDFIDELRARGAAVQIESLAREARGERLPMRPAQHWTNGPPPGREDGDLLPGMHTGA